jgi:hypothetical protein
VKTVGIGFAALVFTALVGCGGIKLIDNETTPVRPDLASVQGAILDSCENVSQGRVSRREALLAARPLVDRYRYRRNDPFRYYADQRETTAVDELDELIGWMRRRCPALVSSLRAEMARPISDDPAARKAKVDERDRRWFRMLGYYRCKDDSELNADAEEVVEEFPERFHSAARSGCGFARSSLPLPRSKSRLSPQDCLSDVGLTRAHSTRDVAFYFRDSTRRRIDRPPLVGARGFSVEILQRSGGTSDEDAVPYHLFVLRDASSSAKSVSQVIREQDKSQVLFWKWPSPAQVRAAKHRCLGIG